MSFLQRINEEMVKLTAADLAQCPVSDKPEEGEVVLGEMDDEQRRLVILRNRYADEAKELNQAHLKFHLEDDEDQGEDHEERHQTLLKSLREIKLILEYLNDAIWASVKYQVIDRLEEFGGTGIRENWQIVGLPESKRESRIEIITMGLGGFPGFPGM
jgi:hypothetical protein